MRTAGIALLSLVALSLPALWLLGRESTLIYAADHLVDRMGGRLQLTEVHGSLLGTIRIRALRFEDKFGKLAIDDAHFEWKPLRLLRGQVAVGSVAASTVALDLVKSDDERATPPESLRSPIAFAITDFRIDTLAITQAGATHELRGLHAAFSGGRRHLQAELKSLATQWGTVRGEVKLGAESPFDLTGNMRFTALQPQDYDVAAKLGGTLLNAEASVEAKARNASAAAKLAVAPFERQPLTNLEFSAKDIDPRAWAAAAPRAMMSGVGRLIADAERTLKGGFTLTNTLPGAIDDSKLPFAKASATLQGTLAQLALHDLTLDLADAGQFAGNGAWKDGSLDVRLATRNFNLRGVQKRLNRTQLAGQLALGGDAHTQRVKLALAQKPYSVRFTGALADGVARIDEAYAAAGNAELATRGRVALDAPKTFTLAGRLSNFDPAQFGSYPSARINSRFALKGHVEPVIQVAASVDMSDSRLFGLPARANGTFRSRNTERPDVDMSLALHIGETHASAKGTLRDPANLSAMDMQLSLAGASLAELYKIVGVPLPPTPAYRIAGRLVHSGQTWALRQFAGAVGDSDLSGTFLIDRGRSPQFMSADLMSNRLSLADLAGFVGAEKTAEGKVTTPNPARVLPDSPYNLDKLKAADADIRFQGRKIVTERLPVDNMTAHLIVKGGVLTLAPLNFGVAGGHLVSSITLDGRAAVIASRADIRVQSLQLAQLMPQLKVSQASVGEMDGRVRLTSRGNSIAAMLGSANGDTALVVGEGEVSDLLLRLSNLDIANTLLVLLRGDRNIPLRCMVADLAFENGVMQPRQFVFDTTHTTLTAEGKADFRDETLDLRLIARPRGKSLVSLRGPIVVGGTFAKPSVLPDMKQLAARGAAATALAFVATPLAAIIPFIQLGGASEVQCGPLLETAKRAIRQPAPALAAR